MGVYSLDLALFNYIPVSLNIVALSILLLVTTHFHHKHIVYMNLCGSSLIVIGAIFSVIHDTIMAATPSFSDNHQIYWMHSALFIWLANGFIFQCFSFYFLYRFVRRQQKQQQQQQNEAEDNNYCSINDNDNLQMNRLLMWSIPGFISFVVLYKYSKHQQVINSD